ncbi:aminotransferase class III-fold pyridoxal phosphate-dependent enzyme [Desulforamulus ruminis]|uniref:aspartate aminotransferase family protein n=1 Tax=Desulforamulus ruminis TaxID=1564 RepID=UPI002FDB7E7C
MSAGQSQPVSLGPFKPVDERMIREQERISLSERKRNYLKAFSDHYCRKNRRSKEHARLYRPVYADQRALAFFHLSLKELCFPLVFQRARGSRLWDLDGNEYTDIAMDFGIGLFGHQPSFLKEALDKQLEDGWAMSMRPEKSARAAELLCRLTRLERAVFSQSGTEAVMTAVRLARHVTKRKKIVMFTNSYHGHSDGLLAFNMRMGNKNVTKPITDGTPPGMVEEVVILEYGAPQALEVIQSLKNELAAVLVEPVQSRGIRVQPGEFLRELRQITEESGIALIFDEMITGFRAAPGGAQEYFNVQPDLATFGKILGGGLSLGAVAGKANYLDAIDGGPWDYEDASYPKVERTFFAGTHCQNTLAMTAAYTLLKTLTDLGPQLQKNLNQTCAAMCERINGFLAGERLPFRVFHFASLFRFEPVERMNPLDQNLFLYHLRDNGIMVSEVGNNFLSTAHTPDEVERIIQAVERSVSAMKSGGYFETTK